MDEARFNEAVELAGKNRKVADIAQHLAEAYRTGSEDGRRGEILSHALRQSTTHPIAWDILKRIAQRMLRDGEPLPGELAAWAIDRLDGKRDRPNRRGRDPYKNRARDNIMVIAIGELVERGFCATRNRATGGEEPCAEGGSACDAVGVAFGTKKYSTVEGVWRRKGGKDRRAGLKTPARGPT